MDIVDRGVAAGATAAAAGLVWLAGDAGRVLAAAVTRTPATETDAAAVRALCGCRQGAAAGDTVIAVPGTACYGMRPSAQFAARLAQAAAVREAVGAATGGRHPVIAVLGGGLPGDVSTEAEVGCSWLRHRGVEAESLVAVPEGHSTVESFAALKRRTGGTGLIVVTDPNHVLRAGIVADMAGFSPVVTVGAAGCPTRFFSKSWMWTLAHETAGLVVTDVGRTVPGACGTALAGGIQWLLRTVSWLLRPSRHARISALRG